ncbi:MAG: FKBP-type peptidyl-prolyl cis-trans isomerase [Micrococcales bacterium]|nr:FKBP-type peptidyl-prolyl cis-trans isomerase [Micrococcales bacterium]
MPRKLTVLCLVGLLGLVGLAGCGQDTPEKNQDTPGKSQTSQADKAPLELVEVTARAGQAPQITLPTTPFTVDAVAVRLVVDGDGAALETGQGLLVRQLAVSGADGSVLYDGWILEPQAGLVVGENPEAGDLDQVLAAAHIGAQVLLAVPTELGLGQPVPADLVLVEVVDAYDILPQATGTPVTPGPGLPKVAVDDDGVPTGITATGKPPASLVVQPLIVGSGAPVVEGQTVRVHYTGWLWDGTQFDSSWDRGESTSFSLVVGGLIDGWVEGLAGQSVGSRVLLVVPPDKGYGDQDIETIPPGSTLVFVVDLLAAV